MGYNSPQPGGRKTTGLNLDVVYMPFGKGYYPKALLNAIHYLT